VAGQGRSDVKTDTYSDSSLELKQHLVDLINNTTDGAIIRISLYGWDDWGTTSSALNPSAAVIRAINRGVSVRILLDGGAKLDADYRAISTAISQHSGKGSFIRHCGVSNPDGDYGRACLGVKMNHNKYFLFSKVGSSQYVVVQSTSHLTETWGASEWDAMTTVVGKKALYDGYVSYFTAQTANTRNPNYYRSVTDGAYKAYFFPRAGKTAYRTADDTIYSILDNVSCTGNTTVGTSGAHRTIIRIAQWAFSRVEVAKKLRQLADKDCWIDIATDMENMTSGVKAALRGHKRINVDNGSIWVNGEKKFYIHAKYLLIEGKYDGKANSKNVWMGSPNMSYPALKENDEALLKIGSASWHDAFRQNFRNIMAVSGDADLG
jgi:phosphatidylserine/phosphatidylglycerophosphate/cardiolipin synthase-like enzyme